MIVEVWKVLGQIGLQKRFIIIETTQSVINQISFNSVPCVPVGPAVAVTGVLIASAMAADQLHHRKFSGKELNEESEKRVKFLKKEIRVPQSAPHAVHVQWPVLVTHVPKNMFIFTSMSLHHEIEFTG